MMVCEALLGACIGVMQILDLKSVNDRSTLDRSRRRSVEEGVMTPPDQLPAIIQPGALATPADTYIVPALSTTAQYLMIATSKVCATASPLESLDVLVPTAPDLVPA